MEFTLKKVLYVFAPSLGIQVFDGSSSLPGTNIWIGALANSVHVLAGLKYPCISSGIEMV